MESLTILTIFLLVTSVVVSCLAAFLAIKLRQRRPRDLETSSSPEIPTYYSYKDKDFTLDFFRGDHEESNTSGLPEHITRSDTTRAAWVLRMTHHVFTQRHNGLYNVVVINNDLNYHFSAEDEVERFLVEYKNLEKPWIVPYSVVVFRQGKLLNMGDGGDINWDWQGNFTRHGDKLLSFKPCVPGVLYRQDPWTAT